MNDIDFLPLEYHQKSAERRQQPWRLVVAAAFLALLGAAALLDYQRRHRLSADLQTIRPQYEKAVAQMSRLTDLQSQAKLARAEADLYTYLRHPWPKTQILSALLGPLPDEIVLEQLKIHQETARPHDSAGLERKPEPKKLDPKAEEAELAKLPPAASDLKRLRAQFDAMQTVAIVTGQCREDAAAHRYLDQLRKNDLFRKVQLRSMETVKSDQGPTQRFVALILVRPGYGQPGGPLPARKGSLAQSESPRERTKPSVP